MAWRRRSDCPGERPFNGDSPARFGATQPVAPQTLRFLEQGRPDRCGEASHRGTVWIVEDSVEEMLGLRLLANGHDRLVAAESELPAFEARLRQLGYSNRAIHRAYQVLCGPGTVAEVLAVLKESA